MADMNVRVHRISAEVTFASGLAAGESRDGNTLVIARNGVGDPVLRGTTVAGVLRSRLQADWNDPARVSRLFGAALGNQDDAATTRSSIEIADVGLVLGCSTPEFRPGVFIDRHTGSAGDGGLFTFETCPPGTRGTLWCWIRANDEQTDHDASAFAEWFASRLASGLHFGGMRNRGVGLARLEGSVRRRIYECAKLADHVRFLDDHCAWRAGEDLPDGEDVSSPRETGHTQMVRVKVGIPRGQDLLIASLDESEDGPVCQRVRYADGAERLRIPGSSLRGVFRGWFSRLARLDGLEIADTVELHQARVEKGERMRPRDFAWAFPPAGIEESDHKTACPVMSLFGSLHQRGRIVFSDAYFDCGSVTEQARVHVSVDQVTGGSNEGLLFGNRVLIGSSPATADRSSTFEVRIEHAQQHEVKWLADALVALHVGVLRLGSSKASGRVEVLAVDAEGPFSHELATCVEGVEQSSAEHGSSRPAKDVLDALPKLRGSRFKAPEFQKQKIESAIRKQQWRVVSSLLHAIRAALRPQDNAEPVDPTRAAELQRWIDELTPYLPTSSSGDASFHNPYTFMPFHFTNRVVGPVRPRRLPTALSAEEAKGGDQRHSGMLEVSVTTRRPLLTCDPTGEPHSSAEMHRVHRALTIDNDVIVPASAVRGAMRSLMTSLTGGSLCVVDPDLFLVAGRGDNIAPSSRSMHLAEIVTVGGRVRPGTVRVGETVFIKFEEIEKVARRLAVPLTRPGEERWDPTSRIHADLARGSGGNWTLRHLSVTPDLSHPWLLRLSGVPVGDHARRKLEGFLLPTQTIELPPKLWMDYAGRHRHAFRDVLRPRDLVWLETGSAVATITRPTEVSSIQWARWGRYGSKLIENPGIKALIPNSMKTDGKVDEVTDLFGQIAMDPTALAPSFAGRIRFENLVFQDVANVVELTELAPLLQPHPGCVAFYRQGDEATISPQSKLRGYKVYRTSDETGGDAPWHYRNQPVFDGQSARSGLTQVNRSCELLPSGSIGSLRITFRSLSTRELALLIRTCSLPWRLGGGKPFGLGLCETAIRAIYGVDGVRRQLPERWKDEIKDIAERVEMWLQSQRPVARLRYPRATDGTSYAGHHWFKRHAELTKIPPREGLEKRVRDTRQAQLLPLLSSAPGDHLTGYDCSASGTHHPPPLPTAAAHAADAGGGNG